MRNELAIQATGLSKRYVIGGPRQAYGTLRDTLALAGKRAAAALRNGQWRHDANQEFWSLRDVSFEIRRGEVVGVIGRNGAGKSTLLKILSRITRPSRGRAEVRGRVGSLLEVGTGFHPELTGRENIFLNGAILGMTKRDTERRFDEIVDFAEIGQFLDTPVKRYSSGMYLRLAFAVAAHLEPDVLFVDEVLAVGDVRFQQKCIGKMQDLSVGSERTVVFISHNMQTVRRLCHRCILLDQGRIVADGSSASIISQFLPDPGGAATPNTWIDLSNVSRRGSGEVRFVAVSYQTDAHRTSALPQPDGPLEFLLAIESDSARSVGSLAVTLYEPSGLKLVNAETKLQGQTIQLREGRTMVRVLIHEVHLNPGVYHVGLWLADPVRVRQSGTAYDHIEPAFAFEIADEVGTANEDMDSPVTCRFEVADVYGAGPTWTAG